MRLSGACFLLALLFSATGCKPDLPARPAKPTPVKPPPPTEEGPVPPLNRDPSASNSRDRGGIEFRRGPHSTQPPSRDGTLPSRPFVTLTAAQKQLISQLLARVQAGNLPSDEALQIVDQVRDLLSADALELLSSLLRHGDKNVRAYAMSALAGTESPRVLPVINRALADPEPDVRLQAVEAAATIVHPSVAPVLNRAFTDSDLNVRQLAFQGALRQEGDTKLDLLRTATQSPHADLAQVGLGAAESESTKQIVPFLMDALDHPDAFIREKAHDTLALMTQQTFKTSIEAKVWWTKFQKNFDDNLVVIDPNF